MTRLIFWFLLIGVPCFSDAQGISKKALFLGNSLIFFNNLPQIVSGLAGASGDSLYFDSNTPGGYTLGWDPIAHARNMVSLAKIKANSWDFVILQEQGQIPVIPVLRDSCMKPASAILHDSVKSNRTCSDVLFFLTWGKRFGGQQCFEPNYCSTNFSGFDQMQDSLTAGYQSVAFSLNDKIAPVGEAWRLILHTTGMVLHSFDNGHPNMNGSYLAACVFYSCIFRKKSAGNIYTAGLLPDTALILQKAADSVVFTDPSQWNLWTNEPLSEFQTTVNSDTLHTHNLSQNSSSWFWDFGDGQTSAQFEPVHLYSSAGIYSVKLKSCDSCSCDSVTHNIRIFPVSVPAVEKESVTLLGPDQAGRITFQGYKQEGVLLLFNFSGEMIRKIKITKGSGQTNLQPGNPFLWELTDISGKRIATGKVLRIQTNR